MLHHAAKVLEPWPDVVDALDDLPGFAVQLGGLLATATRQTRVKLGKRQGVLGYCKDQVFVSYRYVRIMSLEVAFSDLKSKDYYGTAAIEYCSLSSFPRSLFCVRS